MLVFAKISILRFLSLITPTLPRQPCPHLRPHLPPSVCTGSFCISISSPAFLSGLQRYFTCYLDIWLPYCPLKLSVSKQTLVSFPKTLCSPLFPMLMNLNFIIYPYIEPVLQTETFSFSCLQCRALLGWWFSLLNLPREPPFFSPWCCSCNTSN